MCGKPTVLAGAMSMALVLAVAFGPRAAVTAQDAEPTWVSADSGARIMRADWRDERTVDLVIESPGVEIQKVRLLLPVGFDLASDERWPVLYLLHGSMDDHTSWTSETDVEELTAGEPILVVMPAAGSWGWYTDWWRASACGAAMWETFHLTELRQLLERNWHAGDARAVAGVSMGGLGAMSYAARHPGLFRAAASFSGMLDLFDPALGYADDIWGPRSDPTNTWQEHDPLSLAPALQGISLYVSYGDSEGPDDPDAPVDQREHWLAGTNEAFIARLHELGIPVTVAIDPAGGHDWPSWERSLHEAMPQLLEALGV